MGAAFLVTLREGIEAALIISILLGYLNHVGRSDRARSVWWGTAAGGLASLGIGSAVFAVAGGFEGRAEELFEAFASLSAVAVLTWMIFVMRRQAASIKAALQERVATAVDGQTHALATLAFVVVLREGVETALFLFAAASATAEGAGGGVGQVAGAVLGLATAIGLGVLLYRGSARLDLRSFFKVSGGLILFVAAGLLAFSVHEFHEAGLLPFASPAFDASGVVSDKGTAGSLLRAIWGYNDDPSWLEVLAWAGYLGAAGFFYLRPERARIRPATPDAELTPSV